MTIQDPYFEFKPGDLIAAEVFNQMQSDIRADIASQTQEAVDNISTVPRSQDSEKLDGQSLEDLKKAIIDEAIGAVAMHTGYRRLFLKLKVDEPRLVDHQLKNYPLVDVYQLDYFRVVASEDDYKYLTWVNFYIYHSSEKRIRFVPEGGSPVSVEIEPSDGHPYRIPFADLLSRYNVEYTEDSSLGEIESELWDAIFNSPNDRFDDNQYTKSPWFDRCCREERTVKSLKQKGDWDDLWIKLLPHKTVNYPFSLNQTTDNLPGGLQVPPNADPSPRPTQIGIAHYDFDHLGVWLLDTPIPQNDVQEMLQNDNDVEEVSHIDPDELKVMVLLRV